MDPEKLDPLKLRHGHAYEAQRHLLTAVHANTQWFVGTGELIVYFRLGKHSFDHFEDITKTYCKHLF